ncbi:AtzE family amidohydrolase [Lacisediminimonas profundi]|uniref:AtzE family amidohydrolase n=1 Tax=Lacisediminimonas profundi TaxID=2603856 RepID=UPI00124B06FC|nr:AtzE family amidohydrolase [Lacisediminimonas profundi]
MTAPLPATLPSPGRAHEIAAAVRTGRLRAVDVVEQTLVQVAVHGLRLNCFSATFADEAMAQARAIDQAVAAGRDPGPLAGVPVAVKNLFDVAGHTTIAGSKLLRDAPPASADAAIIHRLREAGAIIIGALHMDEFAYGFTTENSHYGPVRNPHDRNAIAGGSSGGSGSAVGAGLVPLALGSDTNGSIRVPAALCGTWGLKPTFGRLSRRGCYPFVDTLDHVGALADSLSDLALSYDAMQGGDPQDPACAQRPPEPVSSVLGQPAQELTRGLRIAVATGYFRDNAEEQAWHAVARAAALLGTDREVTLEHAAQARAAAFVMTASEGGALHWPQLQVRGGEFEPMSRDRLLAGVFTPPEWVARAHAFRDWFRKEVDQLFDEVDVILAPATPRSATPIGATAMTVRSQQMIPRAHMGMLTQPISFIGLPVVLAPFRPEGAMPVGVQIIAPAWREDWCFRVGRALEMLSADFRPRPAVTP